MTIKYNIFFKDIKHGIPAILQKELNKRGFYDYRLVLNWGQIVGSGISDLYSPNKIVLSDFGNTKTLQLIAKTPNAGMYFNYHKQIIQDRVNLFIGFKLVQKVALKQIN